LGPQKINSWFVAKALEEMNIVVNRNAISKDGVSPQAIFYPSGIRLGAQALTVRGMKEKEMEKIGRIIAKTIKYLAPLPIPDDPKKRAKAIKEFEKQIKHDKQIKKFRSEVLKLANKFPIPR
jgi:glycine hydroxymethyltransferase